MTERNYELYRKSALGVSLSDTLDDLITSQQITPQLAMKVLLQFDKSVNSLLAQKVKNKTNFKGHLHTYRFCDNVWTFVLENATFKSENDIVETACVKIVACDAKERQKADL